MTTEASNSVNFCGLSSWEGRMSKILLCLPECRYSLADVGEYYYGLFDALRGRSIDFMVIGLTEPEHYDKYDQDDLNSRMESICAEFEIRGQITPLPMFIKKPDNVELEVWIQDAFLVLKDRHSGITGLMDSVKLSLTRDNRLNGHLTQFVAARCGFFVLPSLQNVVGGDFLCSKQYLFVGDTILKPGFETSQMYAPPTRETATSFLKKHLGVRDVFWVNELVAGDSAAYASDAHGAGIRHLGHVDRFLTLAGPSIANPQKHLVYVAEVRPEYCVPHTAINKLIVKNIRSGLDQLAAAIAQQKCGDIEFEVRRLPLLVEAFPCFPPTFRCYNNCLIEIFGSHRYAYVPVYKPAIPEAIQVCAHAESEMLNSFAKEQITVKSIRGEFPALLGRSGALRCASKLLEREIL